MVEFSFDEIQKNSIFIGILIFDAVASIPTLILPFLSIYFYGDTFIILGIFTASIFMLKQEKEQTIQKRYFNIVLLAVLGGLVVATSLTLVYSFLVIAAGASIKMNELFVIYLAYTNLVAITMGTLTFFIHTLFIHFSKTEII